MTVLVVAPHADDEVLGCGGTLALASERGLEVAVLIVTKGHASLFTDAEVATITHETAAAHSVLSVTSTIYLDLPAPKLDTIAEHEVVDRIAGVIAEVRPVTILMPHHADPHVDHNAVSRAVLVAARPQPGHPTETVLEYETPSETEWSRPDESHWFIPNVYVDISEHIEAKIRAMECYASQLRTFPHPRSLALMRHLAHVRGATIGVHAAEAFRLVRTTSGGVAWFGGRG